MLCLAVLSLLPIAWILLAGCAPLAPDPGLEFAPLDELLDIGLVGASRGTQFHAYAYTLIPPYCPIGSALM